MAGWTLKNAGYVAHSTDRTFEEVMLSDRQFAQLIKRGEGWLWNGYELRKMKEAGKYPPERLAVSGLVMSTETRL